MLVITTGNHRLLNTFFKDDFERGIILDFWQNVSLLIFSEMFLKWAKTIAQRASFINNIKLFRL